MDQLQKYLLLVSKCHGQSIEENNSGTSSSVCECCSYLTKIRLLFRSAEDAYLQNEIWLNSRLYDIFLNCFNSLYGSKVELEENEAVAEGALFSEEEDDLSIELAMTIANTIAANDSATNKFCQVFEIRKIMSAILCSSSIASQLWCALLHSHLREAATSHLNSIPSPLPSRLLQRLLELSAAGGRNAAWARYALEMLLNSEHHSWSWWQQLPAGHRQLVLATLDTLAMHGAARCQLSGQTLRWLFALYKEEVDRINKVDEDCLLEDLDVQVFRELCSCILSISSNETYRKTIQTEERMVKPTIDLLRRLNAATFSPPSPCPARQLLGSDAGLLLRTELVQLLGNLADDCHDNQLLVIADGGLEEIFYSSRKDEKNPTMTEAVTLALACCMRNNASAVQYLRSKLRADDDTTLLDRLGLRDRYFAA